MNHRLHLNEVADRIIEADGAVAHDWLVGVAKLLKEHAVTERDNHHNALACPYCNPRQLRFVALPQQPQDNRQALLIRAEAIVSWALTVDELKLLVHDLIRALKEAPADVDAKHPPG